MPRVAEVEAHAANAGLAAGDTLLYVNDVPAQSTNDVLTEIMESGGETVTLRVERGGEELDIPIAPFYDEEYGRYRVGFTFAQERMRVSLLQSIPFSVSYNAESVRLIGVTLKNLLFKGEGVQDVTGPVGTVYVIQEVTARGGVDIYLELLALISVNLGVMNLLPIPGLDGSRFLFMLVEAIRRKPVPRDKEAMIHLGGMLFLFAVMIFFTFRDVLRLFQ